MTATRDGREALDSLYWRAEILQALYWMRGEELASEVEPGRLAEFLDADPIVVADQLERLAEEGYLERAERARDGRRGDSSPAPFRLTVLGIQEGGRSFHDEFADYVRQAHGECGPGCWCKDPEREGEPCPNREPEPEHAHA